MTVPWIQYQEFVTGQNDPNAQDVVNRPLEFVLSTSGLDPAASFPGFIPIGANIPATQITGLASVLAGYLATTGGTMTGIIKGAGYFPKTITLIGASGGSVTLGPTTEMVILDGTGNFTVTLPLAAAGVPLAFCDALYGLSQASTVTFQTQGGDFLSSGLVSPSFSVPGASCIFIPIPSLGGWGVIGVSLGPVSTTISDTNYIALQTDFKIIYVTLTAARQVTLPDLTLNPWTGGGSSVSIPTLEIWDAAGTAAAHNISVIGTGSQKVNGGAGPLTAITTNFGYARLIPGGVYGGQFGWVVN